MHIDPQKLDLCRDMIDADVFNRSVVDNRERNQARRAIALELGYKLECFRIDPWYVAACISIEDDEITQGLWQDGHMDRAAVFYSEHFCSRICVSSSAEVAETAMICRLLDESVDLSFDEETIAFYIPRACVPPVGDLHFTLCEYLEQERWFGIVHQYGRAIDNHTIRCVEGHNEYMEV